MARLLPCRACMRPSKWMHCSCNETAPLLTPFFVS